MKVCALCGTQVRRGTGIYYARRLIHRACKDRAKLMRFRL